MGLEPGALVPARTAGRLRGARACYPAATLLAANRSVAVAETLDLLSFGALVVILISVLDTPAWLRRAVWAVAAGVGLLAMFAVLQQLTKTYGST